MAVNPNKLVVDVENLKKTQATANTTDSEYIVTEAELPDNSTLQSPLSYEVGNDSLTIYFMGEKLIKADPTNNIDGHYVEVGDVGSISNTIQFYNIGQAIPIGVKIEFVVVKGYNN